MEDTTMFKYYMKSIGLCTLDSFKELLNFLLFVGKIIFYGLVIIFSIDGFFKMFEKINPSFIHKFFEAIEILQGILILILIISGFIFMIKSFYNWIKRRAISLKEESEKNKSLPSN